MHETSEVFDRRAVTRIQSALLLEVQYQKSNREVVTLKGRAANLSEHGVSVLTNETLPNSTDIVLKLRFPESTINFEVTGRVIAKQDHVENNEHKYGIQIMHMPPDSRQQLGLWLSDRLLNAQSLNDRRFKRTIRSELVTFKNARGKNLVGFLDSVIDTDVSGAPLIIITPGFGETKTNALSLSYTLVKNGFRVLRYDATDHTGESDGTIVDCTLSKLKEDLSASIDFVTEAYGCSSIGLILSSLSGVMGLRVAAEDSRISFVGGLVPVVNLKHTLNAVYNEDLVGGYRTGKRWGLIDMLGFPIDADRFLNDAITGEFHSLESTRLTLSKIKAPTWFLVGSNDPWVLEQDVKAALNGSEHQRGYTVIESSMHQLHENPLASRMALDVITKAAIRFMQGGSEDGQALVVPRLREVAMQSRIEKERRKLSSNLSKEEDVQFWSSYLHRFQSIIRIPDFRDFYGTIQRLLGNPQDGQMVLDAGCGNGSYGLWLLQESINQMTARGKKDTFTPYTYVGLDFVSSALTEAREVHREALKKIAESKRIGDIPQTYTYVLADLDSSLPFLDNYFDKIVCSLVLSYVRHPQKTLRELYRILAPGGTLVITTLKPYADLSAVYRNFLAQADTPEDVAEARNLLANAGLIRARETEGHFKFFGETELMGMMLELGASHPIVSRSFANQANVAAMSKARR